MLRSVRLGIVAFVVAGCGSQGALSQALIDQARASGAAPDLIYVVDLPGYELAEQSVGGINEEGFGAFYVSPEGKQVQLRVDRGTFSHALCPDRPVTDADPVGSPVQCSRDEVGWYRQAAGRHEYIAVRDDALLLLAGKLADVNRETLKAAIDGARRAVGTGSSGPRPSPVERGDLPTSGDGAPIQPTGPGG
ncbi:hypothetical protein EDD27_3931 [Nonomuraea polychroma]|uniref:Uncharacterized protein n=1 Tax=Nonomuraea polychroma TaxID=46176 RepID=A0A438M6S0_9ACTN|nr:hypothetical protein [Nonomuraea polychroma]RVX41404.1 hypothetical protein EDD27_3931 [Nonomuraea polychroma]